ncbi:MAG: hypothetical protein NVS3B3_13730 [Aquirhabdus sp.]
MCSVGLGGDSCSIPKVRLQTEPHTDFFVSETSFKVGLGTESLPRGYLSTQGAQLDPAQIRYIVAPTTLAKFGVHYGDVGIAYDATGTAVASFIIGDCCNLGEASISLLAALSPSHPPQLLSATSALGEPVKRYSSGISGDFRFVIFAGTASVLPQHQNVSTIPAEQLPAWIEHMATPEHPRTTRSEVIACTDGL